MARRAMARRATARDAAPSAPEVEVPLSGLAQQFLTELANANRSSHTQRAYAMELRRLASVAPGPITAITPELLRGFFAQLGHLKPASRARMQAALGAFFTWAERQGLIDDNPLRRVESVHVEAPLPRPKPRREVEAILQTIPRTQRRDRVLFTMLFEMGLRVSEALHLYVEDVSLERDNERLTVLGKGQKRRTLLIDDPRLVKLLREYLQHTGYKHGLLFRAERNGDGGPLRYQTVHERWAGYCEVAGIVCSLHQLRHSHASELVSDGVSLMTVRKRLGHANIQTTLRYAEQADVTSDAELRAWRRGK